MILDTLYKRTKTGAIQYWKIYVHDGIKVPQICKESGQLGTISPICHVEDITSGKNIGRSNETTPLQQAESQAQSDWKKKHDEGYKSVKDLGIADHGTYYSKDGQDLCLEEMLEVQLPKFNTDASGNAKPMLAKAVDWKKVTYPCLVQPKLDGVRCLMVSDGDSVTLLSRSGKEYTTLEHIVLDVTEYIIKYENSSPEQNVFILDGEIYSDEISFQDIVAAVKKQRPDSLKLKFRAYDVVTDGTQGERNREVQHLVTAINSPFVVLVSTITCYTQKDIKDLHDLWVKDGNEGAMIRLMDGHYGQGQRSSHLMKVKEFDEAEFAFSHFEFGQRGIEDLIAVCWTTSKKQFKAKMVGSKEHKEELYKSYGDMKSPSLTVKHFGCTDDGLPRFPIGKGFRDY